MSDRFPILLAAALVLIGVVGFRVSQGAKRGAFADRLSTFKSEPDGARGAWLLLEAQRVPVTRVQQGFELIDPDVDLVLLGVDFEADRDVKVEDEDDADGGVGALGGSAYERSMRRMHVPPVSKQEAEKVLEHARLGATVLYLPVSAQQNPLLDALGVELEKASPELGVRTLVPAQPSPFTLGVERAEAEVTAFLALDGPGVPLLTDDALEETVAALIPWGQGQVLVLTAPELFMNKALSRADNAQLVQSLAAAVVRPGKRLGFDEYHHGFTADRSMASFAHRYGLGFAVFQLLFGVALWAVSLRRFGRPREPVDAFRATSADALSATARLYREGRHHGHAAMAIARRLAVDFAALLDVTRAATHSTTDSDLLSVARLAALARQKLNHPTRSTP